MNLSSTQIDLNEADKTFKEEFGLLLLFLTSFDFVTSFDICRQNEVSNRFCVCFRYVVKLQRPCQRRPELKTSVLNISAPQRENLRLNKPELRRAAFSFQQYSPLNGLSNIAHGLPQSVWKKGWNEETEEDCIGLQCNSVLSRDIKIKKGALKKYSAIRCYIKLLGLWCTMPISIHHSPTAWNTN